LRKKRKKSDLTDKPVQQEKARNRCFLLFLFKMLPEEVQHMLPVSIRLKFIGFTMPCLIDPPQGFGFTASVKDSFLIGDRDVRILPSMNKKYRARADLADGVKWAGFGQLNA
jgi:hypothetical protein